MFRTKNFKLNQNPSYVTVELNKPLLYSTYGMFSSPAMKSQQVPHGANRERQSLKKWKSLSKFLKPKSDQITAIQPKNCIKSSNFTCMIKYVQLIIKHCLNTENLMLDSSLAHCKRSCWIRKKIKSYMDRVCLATELCNNLNSFI